MHVNSSSTLLGLAVPKTKMGNSPALYVAPGVTLLRNVCNQFSVARIGTSRPSIAILQGHSAADVVEPGRAAAGSLGVRPMSKFISLSWDSDTAS